MSSRFPGVFHRPGIYAIVHVLSGTRYVGQSRDLLRRFEQHWEMLQLAEHHNPRLQRMWEADGPDAFEFKVIEVAPDLEGMKLQRWLAAKEDLHITTYKKHGLAFNIVDAELVDVASDSRSQTIGTGTSKGQANPNGPITDALRDLAPTIDRLKKEAFTAQAAASRHRDTVLPQLRSDAQGRFFGVLSMFSGAEVTRQRAAQAALQAALAVQATLEAEASRAGASLDAALAQRRALHASYSGNQARALKRLNRRAKYGF